MDITSPQFWVAVLQIIAIDIVLGGDNAVVIALASRRLPDKQRNLAIFWGVFGAIGLRVVLIFFALQLLAIPFLKIVGALLLLWIGVKLLQPEPEGHGHEIAASTTLLAAIKTIIVADAVMSLDNVIAIAGAAKDSIGLVVFGLVVSVPIIVWGSKLVMKLMDRFPVTIAIGAGLLGWIAGDMAVTDATTKAWVNANMPLLHWIAPASGALLIVALGKWLAARESQRQAQRLGQIVAATAKPGERGGAGLRFLLPVDGSNASNQAVADAIKRFDWYRDVPEIHLLNVQSPLRGDVSMFIDEENIRQYHQEEGMKALQAARDLLSRAGLVCQTHVAVGDVVEMIVRYAAEKQCDQIVIGPHGLGLAQNLLLGSVASKVMQLSTIPVLLLKPPR